MRGAVSDCCNSQTLHTHPSVASFAVLFLVAIALALYISSLCNVNLHAENTSGSSSSTLFEFCQ